jgi:hypothetical protein
MPNEPWTPAFAGVTACGWRGTTEGEWASGRYAVPPRDVMPAKAGTHDTSILGAALKPTEPWTPAFAGVTVCWG